MEEVTNYYDAIRLLEECRILVYKPLNSKITYLKLKDNKRIAVVNSNVHYNISFDDLKNLMQENKIFIVDDESNDIEV